MRRKSQSTKKFRIAAGILLTLLVLLAIGSFAQDGTFFVKGRNIGINTANPDKTVFVTSIDGTAQVRVDESAATEASRELFYLRNNGRASFSFEDITQGVVWKFQTRGGGFEVRKKDFPVPNFKMEGSGNVKMGDGEVVNFTLESDGDLKIEGKLSEGSSRAIKSDITGVDAEELLDRLAALRVYEWTYTEDGSAARHIGPMAEDFEALFGLGSDPGHLAPSDTAGLALAAVQGLQEEVEEKSERIAQLERHNALLEDRLARLEAALDIDERR